MFLKNDDEVGRGYECKTDDCLTAECIIDLNSRGSAVVFRCDSVRSSEIVVSNGVDKFLQVSEVSVIGCGSYYESDDTENKDEL